MVNDSQERRDIPLHHSATIQRPGVVRNLAAAQTIQRADSCTLLRPAEAAPSGMGAQLNWRKPRLGIILTDKMDFSDSGQIVIIYLL